MRQDGLKIAWLLLFFGTACENTNYVYFLFNMHITVFILLCYVICHGPFVIRMEDYSHRLSRAARIFDTHEINASFNVNENLKWSMFALEKLMRKELWWDATTLTSYVDKNMIPRGLYIKKIPTATYDIEFMIEWESILTDCSLRLMKLLIHQEQADLDKIKVYRMHWYLRKRHKNIKP